MKNIKQLLKFNLGLQTFLGLLILWNVGIILGSEFFIGFMSCLTGFAMFYDRVISEDYLIIKKY